MDYVTDDASRFLDLHGGRRATGTSQTAPILAYPQAETLDGSVRSGVELGHPKGLPFPGGHGCPGAEGLYHTLEGAWLRCPVEAAARREQSPAQVAARQGTRDEERHGN